MDIKDIRIRSLDIPDVRITDVVDYSSPPIPVAPPVTIDIGVPIVNIPGCVEAHETNNPKNNEIKSDDPDGLVTYCDAGVPSFNPIRYEPEQMIFTEPAQVPKTKTPETPEVPATPEVTPPPPKTVKIDCPTKVQQAQEPVGTYVSGFREIVTGYELIDKTCVQLTEKVPLPKEGVGARALLAAARHRGLEIEISLESGNLAVGGVGVFFHLQQLLAKQGTTDGCGVEAAIADKSTAPVGLKPCLMQQRWIVWGIEINALHLPKPGKPVGVNQVVRI